jgi:HAD superfamily hydrolase (TIGR01490 family)
MPFFCETPKPSNLNDIIIFNNLHYGGSMRAAFFDVDGTLTEHRVWSGVLDYFRVKRVRLVRSYLFTWFHFLLYGIYRFGLMSQVSFRSIWAKNLSWHFAGYSLNKVCEIWDWVIENRLKGHWRENIVSLLRQRKADGWVVFLVSGGPQGLLERITEEVGGDYAVGTVHQIRNGFYTGRSEGIACQGDNKPLLVKRKINEKDLHIELEESFAYADSMSDLQLLLMVGHPVAVYPDDGLREIAVSNGWDIIES